MPQDLDHVGTTTAAQATFEARTQVLNSEVAWLTKDRDFWKGQTRANREQIEILETAIRDSMADHQSLERLYARAIDTQVTLEKTLEAVRTESIHQTEQIRALKAALTPTIKEVP